jgi:hypothetical protein
LIVIPSYYNNGTNDGTPESHARNDGNTDSLASRTEAKSDVNLKDIREYIRTNQTEADTSLREMKVKTDSHHEKLMTIMKARKEKIRAMREACLEATEACLENKEPTSPEVESEAEHEEVPKRPQWKLSEH